MVGVMVIVIEGEAIVATKMGAYRGVLDGNEELLGAVGGWFLELLQLKIHVKGHVSTGRPLLVKEQVDQLQ